MHSPKVTWRNTLSSWEICPSALTNLRRTTTSIAETRRAWLRRLFPETIPNLWCPPITHYRTDGTIDRERTEAHLAHIGKNVRGLLVAGSTGDGWELDSERYQSLLQIHLDCAQTNSFRLLVGVLRPRADQTVADLNSLVRTLSGAVSGVAAATRISNRRVCGFTVCGPVGADLPPAFIEAALSQMFQTGLPLALYQLPQITGYEIPNEMIHAFANRFPNFLFFKDSSGRDQLASERRLPAGVHLLRGAEGSYLRWIGLGGGPYHGLLLSSANCFAAELNRISEAARAKRMEEAEEISGRISSAMADLFTIVRPLVTGNPFANANKAADYWLAWGENGNESKPPRFSTGEALGTTVLQGARAILQRYNLLPSRGYMLSSGSF